MRALSLALVLGLPLAACAPPASEEPPAAESAGRPPGQWSPVERIDLAQELWGIEAPMIEGPPALAWDGVEERLWATRGGSGRIVEVDLDGGPQRLVDLDGDSDEAALFVDEQRRLLIWVGYPDQQIRVADLETGELLHRRDPTSQAGETDTVHYQHRRATYDTVHGWLWLSDISRGNVRGHSVESDATTTVPAVKRPVALDAGPDGRLWILDALSRDEVRLVVYDPATAEVREETRVRVPHWADGPPAHLLAHDDGSISVVGFEGATLGEDYTPEWWSEGVSRGEVLALGEHPGGLTLLTGKSNRNLSLISREGRLLASATVFPGVSAMAIAGDFVVTSRDLFEADVYLASDLTLMSVLHYSVSADDIWAGTGPPVVRDRSGRQLHLIVQGEVKSRFDFLETGLITEWSPLPSFGGNQSNEDNLDMLGLDRVQGVVARSPHLEFGWEVNLPRPLDDPSELTVDEGLGRVVVASPGGMVYGLRLADGEIVASRDLGDLPHRAGGYYDQGNLLVDPEGRRVFMGPRVLDSTTYELVRLLENVQRVVYVGPDWALGTMVEATGAEWLVQLDPVTLDTIESWPLGVSQGRQMAVAYDAENELFWTAEPLEARVTAWPFPP